MNSTAAKNKVSDEQAMGEMLALLNDWQVPEPTPWFDARMMARFRAEVQTEPQSWFARVRDRFLFGSGVTYKPLLAGAMALVLLAGGGSYVGMMHTETAMPPQGSAALHDLQVIDNNEQAIQQMDQLLDGKDDGAANNASSL